MPLRPLTEQQFRIRRKDRRMVWVDAVVFLIGAVMLVGGIGGVLYAKEEPEPFDWGYSFFEDKSAYQPAKHCMGFATAREGCTKHIDNKIAEEGVPTRTTFEPVTQPNVTMVRFTLKWVDEVPITTGDGCRAECGKHYVYTNDSTDFLRLTVFPPAGVAAPPPRVLANDMNTKVGEILVEFPFLDLPDPGRATAFTQDAARAEVYERHVVTEHGALGTWAAEVVVIRAGDQNGTLPGNACPAAVSPVLPPSGDECDLHDDHDTIEDAGPYPPEQYYSSSYDDLGNKWMLAFDVLTYDVQLSVG